MAVITLQQAHLRPNDDPARWEQVKNAGLQVIQQLQLRIQELEKETHQQRIDGAQAQLQSEKQLQAEMEKREKTTRDLAAARQQIQTLTQQLEQGIVALHALEQQKGQDAQQINLLQGQIQAGRQETQALATQVAQERAQVRLLAEQLESAVARGNALERQMRQMAQQMTDQQKQILEGQTRLLQKIEAPGILDRIIKKVRKVFNYEYNL